jgi:hypothetical protein
MRYLTTLIVALMLSIGSNAQQATPSKSTTIDLSVAEKALNSVGKEFFYGNGPNLMGVTPEGEVLGPENFKILKDRKDFATIIHGDFTYYFQGIKDAERKQLRLVIGKHKKGDPLQVTENLLICIEFQENEIKAGAIRALVAGEKHRSFFQDTKEDLEGMINEYIDVYLDERAQN